ncbi:hypothetical protein F511_15693 [Dorcoceras hygrometricum]|uniref:Uncharacterized protein n=1 Tax=Dorcoceras hygrometricum TaxID=472368 RepID=A0A2Z7BEL6_9LAMI|nr:hypothetical protein F511_15693 [Dorcoceras hygrometricum]
MLSRNIIPNSFTVSNSCTDSNRCTLSNSYTVLDSCTASEQAHAIPNGCSVPIMNLCTISEKPDRSDLEYVDRFVCPDQLGALDQIVQISTLTFPQRSSSQLAMVKSTRDGQLNSWRSTHLATSNSLRLETTCDLMQLAT